MLVVETDPEGSEPLESERGVERKGPEVVGLQ